MANRIKAVVFDMDGVIFDSERQCLDGWKILAEREGLDGIEDVCTRCIGRTAPETIRILKAAYGENIDVARLHDELRATVHKMRDEQGLPVKKGAGEILAALRERKIPLAIASSTRYSTVCSQLEAAGFLYSFDVVIGGDMIEKSKPEPDIYLAACERLGVYPEDAAAIEDSFNGIRSAHSAGMTTVMVPDIVKPDEEILRMVDFECADLLAARDTLLKLI